ncbi:MAG: hypothetical protein ACYDBJ_13795 [Aggregatilineales bacterium]
MINYADFRAIVAERPGAGLLNSRSDFNAIQSSKDASGALAMAALNTWLLGKACITAPGWKGKSPSAPWYSECPTCA